MKLDLYVSDLACSAYIETVTRAVHSVDATAQVAANPQTEVSVVMRAAEADIKAVITTAGYTIA
ncbi:heavy-metal-associated domain-containing protein [Oscillatoria sp. CS-180]|uniref:heavy-metal-associated domain-containing protein n=1 Tax=Oscillatoria sp. CS-180 TaxID=3021720 RepID=UPI00233009A6|nr:heavy-metal-associated domain-containing protein [Oscillatoria sp. CS-180]MDB9525671.1 heavy-metal-associated domain-containing protein [Oscillatoria sp. CS-180]